MTGFVYPRLPLSIAHARVDEIKRKAESGGFPALIPLAAFSHPRAAPVATGGRVADEERIATVRLAVWEAVGPWRARGRVTRQDAAEFDLALGQALHEKLEIVAADAAHDETWSFLTLVVFPDIAALRFPDLHEDRLLGTSRNALRRAWLREEVLGDLQRQSPRPLGEDELVGLFERTSLARNRRLLRRLAIHVLEYDGASARSEWARELYKRVTFATGPRLLDALTDAELDALIRQEEGRGDHEQAVSEPSSGAPRVDIAWHPGAEDPRQQEAQPLAPSRDVEKELHQAMVGLYLRAKAELGYNATYFIRMLANDGALVTARRLVMAEHPSEGFVYLWEHRRLDLTVEALVTSDAFARDLDQDLVNRARQRLEAYQPAS